MKVTPLQDRMCYSVSSESEAGKSYRVDLLGFAGAGQCACQHWAMRISGALTHGAEPGTAQGACKHVLAVRRFFLNGLLREMSKQETNPR